MRGFLPLLLLAGALPAAAHVPGRQAATAPRQDAGRLVALIVSDEAMIGLASRLFEANVRLDTALGPEQQAAYAADPALRAVVADRVRSELAPVLRAELPALRTRIGALVAREMTAQEIGEALVFFSSPTGRKALAQAYRGIAESGATDEQQAQQAAVNALMANVAPEDYPALLRFGASPAAAKIQGLDPKIRAITEPWAEDVIARHQSRLARIVADAAADYLAKAR